MTILIIIAAVVLLGLWFIKVQNKLVKQEELCKNSMSQIGVQLSSRWDALTALAELVKSYNEHEYNTLREVIAMRANVTGSTSAADVDAQENALKSAMVQIKAVAEQYPDLKANENFAKTMDAVNVYENQVRLSRMTYNDTVTKYNAVVRQIPDSIVASILGFQTKDYLKEDVSKSSMPSMKL